MFFSRIVNHKLISSIVICYSLMGFADANEATDNFTSELSTALPSNFPPVPVPFENPITEEKRILGKILFWDEQLSIDNSVACGTCHRTEFGGTDPRMLRNPGMDKILETKDDIFGSPGVPERHANGDLKKNPHFGYTIQATPRTAQSFFMGLWAAENFWDGRAGGVFVDPQTGETIISSGGSLENQALGPLLNPVEMALPQRQWQPLFRRLQTVKPLFLAKQLPTDIKNVLVNNVFYPKLFQAAFGTKDITAARIAMAIASYERTLITDQTPWDVAQQNGENLPGSQQLGWELFKQFQCDECHKPPLFTDNKFHNIGIRPLNDDTGRLAISQNSDDHGRMKTPSLRNVALKTHFMHTGEFFNLNQVLDAYAKVPFKELTAKLENGDEYKMNFSEAQRRALINFMTNALTDPRVKNQQFPFDRPQLRTEHSAPIVKQGVANTLIGLHATELDDGVQLTWQPVVGAADYQIIRDDGFTDWTTTHQWLDDSVSSGHKYSYQVIARHLAFTPLTSANAEIKTKMNLLMWLIPVVALFLFLMLQFIRNRAKR